MTMEVEIDEEHLMKMMQLLRSLMKNLITKELQEKLIKMQCIMKFVVKSFLNSYIWVQISSLKTMKSSKTTASPMS